MASDSASIDHLRAHALQIIRRMLESNTQTYAAAYQAGCDTLDDLRHEASTYTQAPPLELVSALRSDGPRRFVRVTVDGRRWDALVRPIGRVDAAREHHAWTSIQLAARRAA